MRLYLLLLAVAALASCDGPDRIDRDASTIDRPAVNGTVPAAAAPDKDAGPLTSDTIPAPFRGVYDESREACTRPSEYRLLISGRELRFHESIGTVARVTIEDSRRILVLADYEGEGEKWQSGRHLALAEDSATVVVSGNGTSLTRVRCG